MEHHFSVEFAERYGMLEAVLMNHMQFWISKNESNNVNYFDGRYWTYNSMKALHKMFPYVSERKLRNALKRLEDDGIIITGNYNKSAYDRTIWYAITEKGKSILQNCKMEVAEMSNGNGEKVKPIPDNNTDIEQIINYLNEKAGTKYRSTSKSTQRLIKARLSEFTVDDCKTVIDTKVKEWKYTDMEQYLRPQTLFGNKFEAYLNQKKSEKPRSKAYREFEKEPEVVPEQMPENMRETMERLRGCFDDV